MSSSRVIKKPIILLGCARSGTTLVGKILQQHPDVAYWVEPRPIWMHGNAYRSHDELSRNDLSPWIAEYIDQRFSEFIRKSKKSRFAEKTPSNCLRIPFIHAIYPDCRIIHIIRDGRTVIRSILSSYKISSNRKFLLQRILETPFIDWPAYIPLIYRTVWHTKVLRRPARYWGPRPINWQDWLDLPIHAMTAKQWVAIVRKAIYDGRALPKENYLELRYETLIENPSQAVEQLLKFTNLKPSSGMFSFAETHVNPSFSSRHRNTLSKKECKEVDTIIAPTLRELGYR